MTVLTADQPDLDRMPDRVNLGQRYKDYAVFWPLPHGQPWSEKPQDDDGWDQEKISRKWIQAKLRHITGILVQDGTPPKSDEIPGWLYHIPVGKRDKVDKVDKVDNESALPSKCPRCDADYRQRKTFKSSLRNHRSGFQKACQVLASSLFREMSPFDDTPISPTRKLVIFSDSRQDAAKLAAGMERDHFRDMVRLALIKALHGYWNDFIAYLRLEVEVGSLAEQMLHSLNPALHAAVMTAALSDANAYARFEASLPPEMGKESLRWSAGKPPVNKNARDAWESLLTDYPGPVGFEVLRGKVFEELRRAGIGPGGSDFTAKNYRVKRGQWEPWYQCYDWSGGDPQALVHMTDPMLDLYRALGTPMLLGRAQTDYADFCRQQGRYAEAETLLESAYTIFTQEHVPLYIADCQLQRGRVALAQGKVDLAERFIASSATFYEQQQRPLAIARVRHIQGDLARMTQQAQLAASLYAQAFAVLAEPSPAEGVQLASALADIAQQADDLETALFWQQRAVRSLQQARSRMPTEELASQLVHQHLPLLRQALTLALRLDQATAALSLAEDARAQIALAWIEVQRRDQPLEATARQLAGRIRSLRGEMNRIQEQLEVSTSEDVSSHLLREFRMRQDAYDQALALWRRFGSNVIPGMPETFDWSACQAQLDGLSTDWRALVYWLDDSWLITWHCTPSGIQYSQRQLSPKELSALRLCCSTESEKREFVYGDDPNMLDSRTSHLQRVAALLIPAQAAATLTPETLLIIVPADMMHALPFAALPLNGQPLVTYATPLIVPSLQLLSRLLTRPATNAQRLLAVGVQHHPQRPHLPLACDEVAMVAQYQAADMWCNEEATIERLQEANVTGTLRQYQVLHLATHAWSHNLYTEQAGFALANGDMLVTDVAHLNLDADLVVLSAGESSTGKHYAGEASVGLVYALLQAGTRAMVVSLWHAKDRTSLEMMRRFYAVRGTGVRGPWGLADAQRSAWRAGIPTTEWAAYQWIGKPAG